MTEDMEMLSYRCSDEDWDTLSGLSERNGISTSDYIIQAILTYARHLEQMRRHLPADNMKASFPDHG